MKTPKHLILAAALLAAFSARAQLQPHGAATVTTRQQRAASMMMQFPGQHHEPAARTMATAKSTAVTKERLRAIFVDYSGGLDSINYFYGSPYRGSSYDYSGFMNYDGGYHYLSGTLNPSLQFDSVHYITQPGYSGPFLPYFNAYASYASDTAQLPVAGHLDHADYQGNLNHSSKFDRVYTATGLIAKEVKYTWDAGLQQYDSSALLLNNYSGGVLQSSEVYTFNPLRNGTRTIFYYNAAGNVVKQDEATYDPVNNLYNPTRRTLYAYSVSGHLYRTDAYAYNSVSGLYNSLPQRSVIVSFTPAGLTLDSTIQQSGYDTTRTSFAYNGANQVTAIGRFKYKPGMYAWMPGTWDTTSFAKRSYPSSASDWTRQINVVKDPNNFDPDSTIRMLDAANQVLFQNSLYSDHGLDEGFWSMTYTYHAPGKIATYVSISVDPTIPDTSSMFVTFTFDGADNPLTRVMLGTDAYGGPQPDSFNVWKDRYYYETYTLPDTVHTTGVASASIVKPAELKAYPNPTSSMLRLSCKAMTGAQLTITNANGQMVRSHDVKLGADEAVIDVSALSPGVYFITLRDAKSGVQANASFIRR